MLFTWDTTDLCIIFPKWHISSTFTLLLSLVGVVLLTAGYELVREASRRYESSSAEYMNSLPSKFRSSKTLGGQGLSSVVLFEDDDGHERSSLLWSGKSLGQAETKVKCVKAALYASQVFYSFFIM